ncbi:MULTISPECIES: hypothetical protein [Leptolyngbya]|jgi:hypothetical protein|uniref:hypothetical protein n=1 Tax=Leptolyngbya TaxID=47251 RepID=UPI00036F2D97|nr:MULTISPECIES: hypothetical protein [Leptolyngbya]MBD2371098.1 hypothetical protein [Leptolyngbya sp. FACHB-161]MBD2377566.1 hypothetical protein [Leptolyngbya sp. FACHB-238]MBD2402019.1 hypothetical protein [Leptolyngbya sp. FACHB-239]MBD2408538.1 hypothetical protein [Leptolyngbya sp. FACHB-402]BAS60438.1 hypothetical protein LBWT_Y0260 [Leptolyngbya boryana IAM M-101]
MSQYSSESAHQQTVEILQQLQVPNPEYAVNLIAWLESIATDSNFQNSVQTEAQRFAIQWHCAKQYAISVLDVADPTPELILEMYRTIYSKQSESAIGEVASAIREFVTELSRIRQSR